ncbi:MAG: D-alanyl-D-alanine carboxypeptidase/D-alanyl-D-alanine endopeptidase [Nodosilinea sp.]
MVRSARIKWARVWLIMALVTLGSTSRTEARVCEANLAHHLEVMLNQPPLDRAYVGFLLQTQSGEGSPPRTLYAHHSDRLFTPASNLKLLTTAAALAYLGPDYRLRTSAYGKPEPDGTTDLRLVGRGDPSLTAVQLQDLARQLVAAGVTRVRRLVLDDSYFPGLALNPTWEWEDLQFAYAPAVNSLIFNQNALTLTLAPAQVGQPLRLLWPPGLDNQIPVINDTLTVARAVTLEPEVLGRSQIPGSLHLVGQMTGQDAPVAIALAMSNPAEAFSQAAQLALAQAGIIIDSTAITTIPAPLDGPELAAVLSPPLQELLVPANQNSNNLYAEVLLKTLGIKGAPSQPDQASQAGADAVKTILGNLGVNTAGWVLVDGSGLSRHNLITPRALVQTLQVMVNHPDGKVFRSSLAVAGVSGTLRHRFSASRLANHLQGKSGAMTGDVALSGYLQPPDYQPLVFSFIINHSPYAAEIMRQRIDAILQLVAGLSHNCEP